MGNGGDRIPASFPLSTVITLSGGTILLMWLGEQITARGVGNGISLIIFAGIVARLPTFLVQVSRTGPYRRTNPALIIASCLALSGGLIAFIVFMERAQRRLFVTYPKRQRATGLWRRILASAAEAECRRA